MRAEKAGVAFAKTTRPSIDAIVLRERLFARLDGTPGRTVAWISGPPGAGKTTLAASYVEARRLRCLWYQLDADDADPATFFHYLVHAARKFDARAPAQLPRFAPQHVPDIAAFSRRFFRQLFALAKAPGALVLDNLHAVPSESALHAALEAAFSQIPRNSCVIVASRSAPAASLARLRVTGEMVCLGWEDLRFGPQELAEIGRLRGQALSAAASSQLHERTQGWVAGLVLMLEHAKLSGKIAELPGDAAPKVIFDYLAGEIFDRFEPKTQRFLLSIACLPRMSAQIAQALSGESKATRLLLNFVLNHYFVSEVESDEGRLYQLHPLLRDFLRDRAVRDLPEVVAGDHLRRAAALLRGAGYIEDAVALLIECRDWDAVAEIAAEAAGTMLAQGRSGALRAWLEQLPSALLESDARLLQVLGTCSVHASPRAGRRHFERAFELFRRSGNAPAALQCCCGVVEAVIDEFDDLAPLDGWCEVLSGLLKQLEASGQDPDPGAADTLSRALLLRDPGSAELDRWLEKPASEVASGEPRDERACARVARGRAVGALLRGNFAAAETIVEAMRAGSSRMAENEAIGVRVIAALQQLLAGANELALRAAREALSMAEAQGAGEWNDWLRMIAAAAALDVGDRDGARSDLQVLATGGGRLRRGDRAILHYLCGWLAMLDGDVAAEHREARAALELAVEVGAPWLECLARVALAAMLAEGGDRRACEAQLRGAHALAEKSRSAVLRFAAQLAAAGAANAMNDESGALSPLRCAFSLGREYGLRHSPWWRSRRVADLCALALRHGIEAEFARGLVRARKLVPGAMPLRVAGWPWPYRIFTLGQFRILRDDAVAELSAKGPGRPIELLKVLIAFGGHSVRAEQLEDALWPRADADYAHKSFTAALHRLRRLLGDDEALSLRDGRLGLHSVLVWVDAWAIEQVLVELEDALRAPYPERAALALRPIVDEALALYRGPFLADESDQPSYIACREQLRSRLLRYLSRITRAWEEAGQSDAAVDCYLRWIDADDLFEAPYRNLMLCYQRRGEQAQARTTYERLRTVLAAKLKAMPSPETQAVYAALGTPVRG